MTKEDMKNEPDNELVEKAYQNLFEIFSSHYENAMKDAGKYILENFYDNNIELARKKKSPNKESLNQLIARFQSGSRDTPSKSWVYNSVALLVQSHDFKNDGPKSFQTYGKISLSHKISLLPVTDMGAKKQLIQAVIKDNLSVRALEELKAKKKIKSERKVSLLSLLNHPEKMIREDASQYTDLNALIQEQPEKLKKYRAKTEKKKEEFEQRFKDLAEELEKHDLYIKKYEELLQKIEDAVQLGELTKNGPSNKPKSS